MELTPDGPGYVANPGFVVMTPDDDELWSGTCDELLQFTPVAVDPDPLFVAFDDPFVSTPEPFINSPFRWLLDTTDEKSHERYD